MSVELQASTIKQVYEVSLPVVSQESSIRRAAFEQGLIEVSVRVSGSSLTPTLLDLTQASRMVRRYRYQSMNEAEISAHMKKSRTLIAPKYKLWMQFDDGKVKQQLRENALPIWGYQRPNVLVWLAVKDGRNRYLLKESDRSEIKTALDEEARRRGLPIIWPKLDAQDKQITEFSDVWGQFWEPVNQASKRYAVDAIILGRMNWIKGGWQVDWTLQQESATDTWQLSALDLGLLMGSGIGVATDHISSRFAVFADSANDGELIVRISDLNNVKKYAAASHYLASLAPVKGVYATKVNQHQVDFHVDLSGDKDDLKRIIALGKVLTPDTRIEVNNFSQENAQQINLLPPGINANQNQQDQTQVIQNPVDGNTPDPKGPEAAGETRESEVLRYRMNG